VAKEPSIRQEQVDAIAGWGGTIRTAVGKVILGKREVVDKMLVALLCRGHVLLEDVPGVGKTVLANTLARSIGGGFSRIQSTPDLLPTDVTGVSVYNPKDGTFSFQKGPIHSNVVLVDEINRATPRTQSALLEAMAEAQVTIDGTTMQLPEPFFLVATENPIEFEGTFPLPEAQKDRFFLALSVGYPDFETELAILENQRRISHPMVDARAVVEPEDIIRYQGMVHTVFVQEEIRRYIVQLVTATRNDSVFRLGVSPRGSLGLFRGAQALAALKNRTYVVPDDVKELFLPVCEKRVVINPDQVYKGVTPMSALSRVLASVEVPPMDGTRGAGYQTSVDDTQDGE
jgi:MoxR-like ATPase